MSEPLWLSSQDVIETNQDTVRGTGEPFLVRDSGLLESACDSPKNHYLYGETNILRLATVFLFALARNHPFEQGNKRTALTAALTFLEANGYLVALANTDWLGECVEAVIKREMTENQFILHLQPFVAEAGDYYDVT